jgi:hypothetical protein
MNAHNPIFSLVNQLSTTLIFPQKSRKRGDVKWFRSVVSYLQISENLLNTNGSFKHKNKLVFLCNTLCDSGFSAIEGVRLANENLIEVYVFIAKIQNSRGTVPKTYLKTRLSQKISSRINICRDRDRKPSQKAGSKRVPSIRYIKTPPLNSFNKNSCFILVNTFVTIHFHSKSSITS